MLGKVRGSSPLLQAYEAGYSIEEVRKEILDRLIPEFKNETILERYSLDLLAVEAVNIGRIRSLEWTSDLFDLCIGIRRKYITNNPVDCAMTCALWEESIGKALSLYWSIGLLEYQEADLELEEFAYETFRIIGGVIEGVLQVYLKELLHITERLGGETLDFSDVESRDLGTTVRLIGEKAKISSFLTLSPWGVPLNQWRNIAQHYSVSTLDNIVTCYYGARRQHTIKLSRADLLKIARSIIMLFSAVRTAQTIFTLDNADILVSHCKGFKRKDADLQFEFAVGAASLGFEVISLDISDGSARALLSDVTCEEPKARSINAYQFVYSLWLATRKKKIIIDYKSKSGKIILRITANSEDCQKIFNRIIDLESLIHLVNFQANPKL